MTFQREALSDTVTLYLGDCLEVLPTLAPGSVDAVVTDPPYGIGFEYSGYDDTLENWTSLINACLPELRRVSRFIVMPSCAITRMSWWYGNHAPDWIIAWYKGSPGHAAQIGFNDWEPLLCWGKPAQPMHDYFRTRLAIANNGHPCPKPVEWATWLVSRSTKKGGVVLDPFMGSGTTGVAAVKLGRRFIGIEKEPRYYAIARRRISEALAQPALFQVES